MTPRNYSILTFIFLLISCNTSTNDKTKQVGTSDKFAGYPTVKASLNKKNISVNSNYFLLAKSTDSTVHLIWGNDTIKRTLNEEIDLRTAERLHKVWESNDYLILKYGTGSGVWINIILPLNNQEDVQEFGNGLCFDSIYNLLGIQQQGDTILFVQNLKTKERQYIIDKEHHCDAVLNNSCIDTIGIRNKKLYLKWVIPNNFADEKTVYEKTISLKL